MKQEHKGPQLVGGKMYFDGPLIMGAEQWPLYGEYDHWEKVVGIIHDLGIKEFRTCFSWADWTREDGPEWFDWFIGKLRDTRVKLLPALFYTPPDLAMRVPGEEPNTAFPPASLSDYAAFVRTMIRRYGDLFDWLQIWNEPNNDAYWRFDLDAGSHWLDPGFHKFADMAQEAIDAAQGMGKKVVFGGLSPADDAWFELMHDYNVLQKCDAIGVHFFPGTWQKEKYWPGWNAKINALRSFLAGHGLQHVEIHITETGFSTWGESEQDEAEREKLQIEAWEAVRTAPAERVYWHTLIDQKSGTPTDNVLNRKNNPDADLRAYRFGIVDEHMKRHKPLYYHWKEKMGVKAKVA